MWPSLLRRRLLLPRVSGSIHISRVRKDGFRESDRSNQSGRPQSPGIKVLQKSEAGGLAEVQEDTMSASIHKSNNAASPVSKTRGQLSV